MTDIKMYSLKDVQDIMQVTQRTVYNYLKDGKLKAVKIGKYYKVSEDNLKSFLEQNKAGDKEKQVMQYLDQGSSTVCFYAQDLRAFGIDVSVEELKELLITMCDRKAEIKTESSFMLLPVLNGFMLDYQSGDQFNVSVNPDALRIVIQQLHEEQ